MPTKQKKKLYKVNPLDMPFGTGKGSHVAHLYDEPSDNIPGFTEINETSYLNDFESGYEDVSREELFSNIGECRTVKQFKNFAEISSKLFDEYQDDKDIAAFCYAVKDYLTADGRAPQQKALTNMKLRLTNVTNKLMNKADLLRSAENKTEKVQDELENVTKLLNKLGPFHTYTDVNLNGNLTLDFSEKEGSFKEIKDGKEPQDVFTGRVGFWKKSTDSLFPHEPSPNDVKQGLGVQDCFALSVLTQLAANDPDYIKDMMRDNNDGTVSVRFYTHENKYEKQSDGTTKTIDVATPVIVTVNKTVNKSAFGQDMYANSSLWVQMIEKAYAKYNAEYGYIDPQRDDSLEKNQKGMGSIWRNYSYPFMDAIFKEQSNYVDMPLKHSSEFYKKDSNGKFINHPDFYVPEEEKFFDAMKKVVNSEQHIVTTMPEKETQNLHKSPHDVGLRNGHIYTIRKVFEDRGKKFIQLRDPYGTFRSGYDKDGKLVNKSDVIKGTVKSGADAMGTFNMELKDYFKHFSIIQGIPNSDIGLITAISDKERNYDEDPLTPDEMKSRENYDDLTWRKNYETRKHTNNLKYEGKLQMLMSEKEAEAENKAIYEAEEAKLAANDMAEAQKLLDDPEKLADFAKQIKVYYDDIKSTDEFYVATNTKAFREMRNSIRDLSSSLEKIKTGKLQIDEGTAAKLAESIRNVRNKSAVYSDAKAESINKKIGVVDRVSDNLKAMAGKLVKRNTVSERAFHRYTSAVSINNICSYQKPLGIWPGKSMDALAMYRADLNKRIEVLKNDPEAKTDVPLWKLEKLQKNVIRMYEKDAGHLADEIKGPEKAEPKKEEKGLVKS